MTQIEDIDPADSEPMGDQRSFSQAHEEGGAVGLLGEVTTRLLDLIPGDKDITEELSPETVEGLVSIGLLSGVSTGGGIATTRIATQSRSLASITSRSPSQVGRAVSRARSTIRRTTPRRPGSHSQAASPPPLRPFDTRLGTGTPLQRFSERTALHAQQGARTLSQAGRRRRMLTGPRGVLSRLGVSPETRGLARAGTRTIPIAGTLGVAVAEGLTSGLASELKDLSLGGEGSSPASDQARARAIDSAMTEALQGNVQEAEDQLIGAGVEQAKVDQALDAAQQARNQANPSPLTEPESPPGRTLQNRTDSLADMANSPGMSPTVRNAIQGQQDAAQALAQSEELTRQIEQGQFPPVYVSEGPTVTGPPGTERTNLRRVNQVLGDVFDMDRATLTDLQHKLFAAGFYGARNYDSIRFGAKDPATMSAFQGFLEQAAMKTNRALAESGAGFSEQQGEIRSPTGISSWKTTLERWASDAGGLEGALEEDAPDPTFVVTLTDPEAIKSQMEQLSRNVIGRGISPRAEQRFVSMFHKQQRDAQLSAQRAQHEAQQRQLEAERNRAMAIREMQQGGGRLPQKESPPSPGEQVVEVTQPNLAARSQAFLESEFPTEAGAFGTVQQYDDFLDIIGATRG